MSKGRKMKKKKALGKGLEKDREVEDRKGRRNIPSSTHLVNLHSQYNFLISLWPAFRATRILSKFPLPPVAL
jgi:hypothetical protein